MFKSVNDIVDFNVALASNIDLSVFPNLTSIPDLSAVTSDVQVSDVVEPVSTANVPVTFTPFT